MNENLQLYEKAKEIFGIVADVADACGYEFLRPVNLLHCKTKQTYEITTWKSINGEGYIKPISMQINNFEQWLWKNNLPYQKVDRHTVVVNKDIYDIDIENLNAKRKEQIEKWEKEETVQKLIHSMQRILSLYDFEFYEKVKMKNKKTWELFMMVVKHEDF